MKKENGITLISIVIYIIIMAMVISIMSVIINDFQKNENAISVDTNSVLEFNNFNNYFLKEVKSYGNAVDSIKENEYILFTSGNTFTYYDKKIFYNNLQICSGVEAFKIKLDANDNTIIYVKINFDSFNKEMSYKVENMY